MAQGTQAIRRRIKSVETTKKITNAMELISTTKLRKMREKAETTKIYSENISSCVANIYAACKDNVDSIYFKDNKASAELTIVFTSDLGLCGAYNANTFKLVQEVINKKDPIVMIGNKGYSWAKNRNYNLIDHKSGWDDCDYGEISVLINEVIELFVSGQVKAIKVIYTEFINAVTFKPQIKQIMPIDTKNIENVTNNIDTIFEPNAQTVLNSVIPMYLKSTLYSMLLETKTSEQASRRLAMENATDNAEELKEKLILQFNQARQAAITQEISEIVGGADAL